MYLVLKMRAVKRVCFSISAINLTSKTKKIKARALSMMMWIGLYGLWVSLSVCAGQTVARCCLVLVSTCVVTVPKGRAVPLPTHHALHRCQLGLTRSTRTDASDIASTEGTSNRLAPLFRGLLGGQCEANALVCVTAALFQCVRVGIQQWINNKQWIWLSNHMCMENIQQSCHFTVVNNHFYWQNASEICEPGAQKQS